MTASYESQGQFPATRLRRLRQHPAVRRLVRQTTLSAAQLIWPLFVRSGKGVRQEIRSMPGVYQLSIDTLVEDARLAQALGLGGIILFGIPDSKDAEGSSGCDEDGIIPQAIRAVKSAVPELLVATDVCFCEYTSHGHCGVLHQVQGRTEVANDPTLLRLAQQAVSHARAGADVIAPSGMMDGMVGAIRRGLDEANFAHLPILSYAVKFASAFYGPFRDAAESSPQFGDRRGYQMDPACDPGQALREAALDLAEGADMLMVKPALAYMDLIRAVREAFPGVPTAAYNVSGEYSMIKAAAAQGWLDERAVVLESLTGLRRAGADILLTYWAPSVARWLQE